MSNREFQSQCRRLMWRSVGRDWWLFLAKLLANSGFYGAAHSMADVSERALRKDTQEFAALMRAQRETAARTLRA